jgi:heat shock protein HtpX
MSNMKVFVLMAGMTALFIAIGGAIGGQGGMVTALVFAGLMNFVMYYASASMVLRMYGARAITAEQAPELYGMVDRLRQRAGLPMPTVAIAPHDQPNAFATGRNPEHAVVCVTEGIMRLISRDELEGVIAHELAHIRTATCFFRRSVRRWPVRSAISRTSGSCSAVATMRIRIHSLESG